MNKLIQDLGIDRIVALSLNEKLMKPLEFCGVRFHPDTVATLKKKENMSEFIRNAVTAALAVESQQKIAV